MTNLALDGNFLFDIELSISDTDIPDPFTGSPSLIGVLENRAVILLVKNQTDRTIFFGTDEDGERGTTMVEGESFVLDCRGNQGRASNGGFAVGTSFFATVPADAAGQVVVSIIYVT